MSGVVSSHVDELEAHVADELIYLVVHPSDEVYVLLVLSSDSILEFFDQYVLLLDDLKAS